VTVTFAPAITAPVVSCTMPSIPLENCANAGAPHKPTTSRSAVRNPARSSVTSHALSPLVNAFQVWPLALGKIRSAELNFEAIRWQTELPAGGFTAPLLSGFSTPES